MTWTIEWDARERGNKGQRGPEEWFDVLGGRRRATIIKKTLGIGDYAIWWHTHLKVLLENKEWDDLAGSMKSGHLDEQLTRMSRVRDETGCVLVLVVSGRARKEHGRVEIKHLQAKLDHIMLGNRAHVIYTDSIEATVARIYELLDNIEVDEREEPPQFSEANKVLALSKDHSPEQTQIECFMAVPQLSIATARILSLNKWSLWNLYEATADELAAIQYPSGARLGPQRAKKITDAMGKRAVWIRILEQIQGVTKKTAELIFAAESDIYNWTEDKIAAVAKTEKSRVGPVVAARIIAALEYKLKK